MAAAVQESSVCPRCGRRLNRKKRHFIHRLLSVVYPVRYFECTKECGFTGLRFSSSQLKARKRRLKRLLIFIFIALCGLFVVRRLVSNWSQPVEEEEIEG